MLYVSIAVDLACQVARRSGEFCKNDSVLLKPFAFDLAAPGGARLAQHRSLMPAALPADDLLARASEGLAPTT